MSGPGTLSFITHEDIQVHVHAANEIPYGIESDLKENIYYGSKKEIIIKVIDMVNDNSVKDIAVENRKCRFSWERVNIPYPLLYNQYSYSTCSIECLMDIQLELCNCTHHLMPKRLNEMNIVCDIEGLVCLTNNFGRFSLFYVCFAFLSIS